MRTRQRSWPIGEAAPRRFVAGKLVVRATGGQRGRDMLGRQHPGQYGVVAALDARHVHEARGAADQRTAGKRELRHRLPAAFGDCARAVANPLAAGERVAHQRMGLEALEFLERRKIGILVIEVDDEADRNQIVVEVIEERTAAGAVAERPADRVLDQPLAELVRRDLPKLLEADAEFLRFAVLRRGRNARSASCDRLPRAPSANSVYLARSSMPRVKLALWCPSLPMPMSPVATPATAPFSNSTSAAAKPG